LNCPPEMAYGELGSVIGIPGNATIKFRVKVLAAELPDMRE